MAEETSKTVHTLPPAEAARWLGVDLATIRGLVQARFLTAEGDQIPLAEVRAFQARNAEGGSGAVVGMALQSTDVHALIDALDLRRDDLSGQVYETFAKMVPAARQWNGEQRTSFIKQANGRFGAILAVIDHGSEVDEALQRDLQEVGASAAWSGASLPQLLLVLRISRDLLSQTALRIAAEGHGRWNTILDAFSLRLFPAIDRLTDALSTGYWSARVAKYQEQSERLTALVETASFGAYEVDVDGRIQYVNQAFTSLVEMDADSLIDMPLSDVLKPVSGSIAPLLAESHDSSDVAMTISVGDASKTVTVERLVRRVDGRAIAYAGVVTEDNGAPQSRVDVSVLARHVFELRRSIEVLTSDAQSLVEGVATASHDEIVQATRGFQQQAHRLMIVVDELDADRKRL